jgi:hypothetical protein
MFAITVHSRRPLCASGPAIAPLSPPKLLAATCNDLPDTEITRKRHRHVTRAPPRLPYSPHVPVGPGPQPATKSNKEFALKDNSFKKLGRTGRASKTTRALLAAFAMVVLSGIVSAQDTKFFVSTGNTDSKLGALTRRPTADKKETETADDFDLRQMTVITGASITGLLVPATVLSNITNVEVEMYHVFPIDSVTASGNVPSRANSPSDVEIASATRDASLGTLRFTSTLLDHNFLVKSTVINGINKKPLNLTHGEGPATGVEVRIDITFTAPILLPAGHYFFRPEVQVADGNFLYLSAPRPILAPGTAIAGDLQAWIRNSDLAPDWLRIGTDIIADPATPTFEMTFSLTGTTIQDPGTTGQANCHGQTISGLAAQFGSISAAATALGFATVDALQNAFNEFCEQ